MSPEQATGRNIDFRSDQFSFGAVIYELLAGQRAFQRPTAVETLSAILRDEPPPLASTRADASDAFQRVIGRCLEKAPEQRFASTRELAAALDALMPESSTAVAPSGTALPDPAAAVPARRALSRLRLAVLAAVVARRRVRCVPLESTGRHGPAGSHLGRGAAIRKQRPGPGHRIHRRRPDRRADRSPRSCQVAEGAGARHRDALQRQSEPPGGRARAWRGRRGHGRRCRDAAPRLSCPLS